MKGAFSPMHTGYWLLSCVLFVSMLSGCEARPPAGSGYRIAVVPKGTTHVFWESIHAGAVKAARERGNARIIWDGPPKEDQRDEQQRIVERLVSEGVNALVLAPCDRQTLIGPVE